MGNEQSNLCGDDQFQFSSNQMVTQQIITPTIDNQVQQNQTQQNYFVQAQSIQSQQQYDQNSHQQYSARNQSLQFIQQPTSQRVDILAANPLSGVFVQDISQQHLQNQQLQNSQIWSHNPVQSSRISELPNLQQNTQFQSVPLQQSQIQQSGHVQQISQHSNQQIVPQQQLQQTLQPVLQQSQFLSVPQQIIPQTLQFQQEPQFYQQYDYNQQQQQQQQQQLLLQQKQEANRRACDTLNQLRIQFYEKVQQEIAQIPENQTLNEQFLPQLHNYFIQVKNENGQDFTQDPYHGEVCILQHKLNPEYKLCLKVLSFSNVKEWRKAEKEYQVKQLFNHTHLINIHILHSRKFLCICNTTYHLCIVLDHILNDLRQIEHLDEQGIWNLADNVVDALYTYQLKGIPHENISFSKIVRSGFIDNSIVYKVRFQEGGKTNFQRVQENKNGKSIVIQGEGLPEPLFLCPNQWNAIIQQRQTEDSHDRIRSDVFTFGMILLHYCLDQSGQQELLTLYSQNGFLEEKLKSLFRQIKSKHLYNFIENMLRINEIDRPDWIALSETLNELAVKRVYHQHLSLTHMSIFTKEVQKQFEKRLHSSKKPEKSEMISDRQSLPFTSQRKSDIYSIIPSNLSDIKQTNSRIARIKQEHLIEEEELQIDLNMNDISTMEKRHRKQMNFPDGYYDGEVMDGKRDGLGQAQFDDGRLYDGCWKNDKPHGHGTLYSKEGVELYQGNFFNGLFDGFGAQRNPNPVNSDSDYQDLTDIKWIRYTGDHYQGQWDGFGNLEFTNGEKFVGAFSEGYPNGVGVYHTTLKQCINGQWVMGHLVKKL